MRLLITLLAMFSLSLNAQQEINLNTYITQGVDDAVVINEVDSDSPGTDVLEFIELYGPASFPLDGYVVVLYNGSSDQSYGSFDLDGMSLDENGFFVLGSAAVPNVDMIINDNTLQNGPDAIALYQANGDDFPTNTAITFDNLIDAVVYETNDSDDEGLLALLNEGEGQANESANSNSGGDAVARIPDGGAPFTTSTYVAQEPTPGFTNELQCDGGSIGFEGIEESTTEICVDQEPSILEFNFMNTTPDADYFFVLADENDNIISILPGNSFDFLGQSEGVSHVWGLSAMGALDEETTGAGSPVEGLDAAMCAVLSTNFLTINKVNCIPPNCDGGTIFVNGATEGVAICVNGFETVVQISQITDTEEQEYLYALTDFFGEIIEVFDFNEYDFGGFDPAVCLIYGVAYTGILDTESIQPGEPVGQISSDDCVSISENAIEINKVLCSEDIGCSDLFFSEYIEGNSQNKALEIYNPTPFTIDLSAYSVSTYNDGSIVAVNTLNMSGMLEPGEVYVIGNSNANPQITAESDIFNNVTFFNGNDAIVLRNNGVEIDIIGIVGENPGKATPWEVDGGAGSLGEHTIVRYPTVTEGQTDWDIAQDEWQAYPQDTFGFLGDHTVVPCNYPEVPTLGFSTANINVVEGNSVTVTVNIAFPIAETDVQVVYAGGSATEEVDFENEMPVDMTFPEGEFESMSFTFNTIDDLELEGAEDIVIELQEVSEAEFLISSLIVTILPSDDIIPVYEISGVSGNNETLSADSLGVVCELRGVSHGLNTNPDGVQFTLIDDTDGINVYHPENNFLYEVAEGDSLHIIGTIDQFSGLTQIVPDTIILIESGLDLYEPQLVDELNETTESNMIQLKCMEIVDPSEWTNSEPGFSVTVTDGSDEFELRIDADTDIFGTDVPEGVFSIFGIGGQFDSSEPFDDGYQILPRYLADLSTPVFASFDAPATAEVGEEISFANMSEGAANYLWDFGDDTTTQEEGPSHTYTVPGTYTITLTAFDSEGICQDQFTFVIEVGIDSIDELDALELIAYPNPTNGQMTVKANTGIDVICVFDATGRVVVQEAGAGNMLVNLDLSQLAQGSYTMEVNAVELRSVMHIMVK
ncbi:MAG: lamin tail domain-containing protein [Flavobacteriales bacterium]|nr:lamin tail domain-containing protein [Flavobacteriales bacterium]